MGSSSGNREKREEEKMEKEIEGSMRMREKGNEGDRPPIAQDLQVPSHHLFYDIFFFLSLSL